MSAVDFESWAVEDLVLTLGERTYRVRPPSVADMKKILAAAVLGEVNLGLVAGPVPEPVQAVLDTFGPDDHPALGDAHSRLIADGVHPTTIDRMAYYAVFYWSRGKTFADWLAVQLFTPRDVDGDEGGEVAGPKGS